MATSDESNSTFTLAKAIPLTSEMALIVPSPARAMISGGIYRKMPSAIHTTFSSSNMTRSTMPSGSGRKDTHQLQKVVKYPNTMPTATCSRFTGLKFLRSKMICSSTSEQCSRMVALPISMPQMHVMA